MYLELNEDSTALTITDSEDTSERLIEISLYADGVESLIKELQSYLVQMYVDPKQARITELRRQQDIIEMELRSLGEL